MRCVHDINPQPNADLQVSRADREGYQDAIAALNSLQTNFAIIEELRKSNKRGDLNKLSIPEMVEWLRRIGYQVCVFPVQSDTRRCGRDC